MKNKVVDVYRKGDKNFNLNEIELELKLKQITPNITKIDYNKDYKELKIYYDVRGREKIRLFRDVSQIDYDVFQITASNLSYNVALEQIKEKYNEFEYRAYKIKNKETGKRDLKEIIVPLVFDENQFNLDSKKYKPSVFYYMIPDKDGIEIFVNGKYVER